MSFADPPAATMATFAAPAAGADCGGAMAGRVGCYNLELLQNSTN